LPTPLRGHADPARGISAARLRSVPTGHSPGRLPHPPWGAPPLASLSGFGCGARGQAAPVDWPDPLWI